MAHPIPPVQTPYCAGGKTVECARRNAIFITRVSLPRALRDIRQREHLSDPWKIYRV